MKATTSRWWIAGLAAAFAVVLFSPLASPHPDGLERVAEDHGFIGLVDDSPYEVLPDYTIPEVENRALSTIGAGAIGVVVVSLLGYGLARIVRLRRRGEQGTSGQREEPRP